MKRSLGLSSAVVFSLSTGALSGCGDPLKFGQELQDARVLGVRVVSESEGAAALIPGREVAFRVLLAGPKGPFEARVGYEICQTEPTDRGVPLCANIYGQGTTDLELVPEMSAITPMNAPPNAPVAVLGVACQTGVPNLAADPVAWNCAEGDEPLNFSFDTEIQGPGRINHNPNLKELAIQVNDRSVLPGSDEVPADCGGATLRVSAEEQVPVEMYFGESIREAFDDELNGATLETIQISHFATGGRFDRQFSILEPQDEPMTVLDWEAPSEPGPVKIYAVLRDGFGGVNWFSVNVCVE